MTRSYLPGPAVPRRLGTVIVAVCTLVACTSNTSASSSASDERPDLASTSRPGTSASTTPSATTTAPVTPRPPRLPRPRTLAEYERRWASERDRIVAELSAADYGVGVDGVLRGPGGFMLDTAPCPTDWSATDGVDAGSVQLAQFAPVTSLSTAGHVVYGMQAYFDEVNASGGLADGRVLDIDVLDDGFMAGITAELVGDLLAADEQPFAVSPFGTEPTDAVNGVLNEACVPVLLAESLDAASADPSVFPWTTTAALSQQAEAALWSGWIAENMTEPVTVGALVMDNDFGRRFQDAFTQGVSGHALVEDVVAVRHEPGAESVATEMAVLAASRPDVLILMTAGNPCLLAVQESGRLGLAAVAGVRFLPSSCTLPAAYLVPAGEAADGWLALTGPVKDTEDPAWSEDPWVVHVESALDAAGLDYSYNTPVGDGYGRRAWAMHQILEIANRLEGGLTRPNLILAQRGLSSMTHPMHVDGVDFGMWGNDDWRFVEGSRVARYDAADARWVGEGVVDLGSG